MKKQYTMLVCDMAGVLNRITGYIRRNGWNIERLRVEPKGTAGQSEMVLELVLTAAEAMRFEQRLKDWNFVFEISNAEESPYDKDSCN